MYATRVIAGLIAGAVGAIAGLAAAALVAFLIYPDWPSDPFPASRQQTYRLPIAVFVLVFMPVMAAVFRALERMGIVGEPPAAHNALGLSDRPADPVDGDDTRRQV